MSDPMTNLDADEVLASIRRLVAETHSHIPNHGFGAGQGVAQANPAQSSLTADAPRETPSKAKDTSPAPAALVLTPDFRVEKTAVTRANTPHEPVAPLVLSMEQAVHVPQEERAPETEIETLVSDEVQAAAQQPTEPGGEAEDWSAELDDTPDEVAAAHVARLSLEQRIAELEAAVGAQGKAWGMEWEPDGSEDLEAEIPRAMPRVFTEPGARVLPFGGIAPMPFEMKSDETPSEDEAEDAYEADGAAMTQAEDQANDVRANDEQANAEQVSDAMGEIADAEVIEETAFQSAQDAVEDTSVEDVADIEDAEIAEDETPAQGVAPDPDPSLEEELALAGYADEDILDEEALRELIAQVIREELQGELGQRITRNVRRLVRREVQRALTLREFE
ncbi:hypothetical protein [Celeribacter sp.]|uniref:hypothetical protein n=1 Tax=Celeribacter sp. TaxID=1890673 RepID=UPI003A905DA4